MRGCHVTIEPDRVIACPSWGTGWEKILDQTEQQITVQLKVIGFRLPLKRQFPYSQVVRVGKASRQAWWSRGLAGSPKQVIRAIFSAGTVHRGRMSGKGHIYDIWVTVKGGKTIKLRAATIDMANEIERECKQRLGLSKT
ncbi:hypothetical protein ACFLXE_08740 [Chloroflexota bacterium]